MILIVASFTGTASPNPTPATAVLMPTTRARPSASAPPELPGLSAASVWMTLSTMRPARVGSERPSADTTPAVTDPANPCGLPIATTSWPPRSFVASPSSAGTRSSACARSTARSESGSDPTISASSSRPSTNEATTRGDLSTTWADVTMNPSRLMTTPLPPPRPLRRFATDGASRSLTAMTACEYASSASCSSTMNLSAMGTADGSAPVMVAVVPEVEVTREGAVLTITLNRPDVLNALNRAVHEAIHDALELAQDPSVRAVVITGAGRGFCVGQDLQEFSSGAGTVADNLRSNYHRNVLAIRALEKPVIAAVNGPAAGAGMSLAFACDVRIASDSATFVPAFVNIGLVPDSGGTWLVRRVLGTARAFEWLATGRKLPAEEARQWGVVSGAVPAEELAERAREVAELFAAMPTRAIWETKRLLDAAETSTFEEQLELEATTQAEVTQTVDFREGVAAFLEKREPAFTGAAVQRPHPIHLVVTDDLKRWRLTVALRWLLAL